MRIIDKLFESQSVLAANNTEIVLLSCRFQCSVDMKCMVSYIQWYHQPFNDTPKLLRTGASSGNPYSYVIKVRRDHHTVLTAQTLHTRAGWTDLIAQNLAHLAFYFLNRLSLPLPTQYFFILLSPLHRPNITFFCNR